MKTALSTLRAFVGRILRRFVEEDFFQLSAGLAFTTLLALVPLVGVLAYRAKKKTDRDSDKQRKDSAETDQ